MSDFGALMDSIVTMSPSVALMVGLNALMYYLRRTPHIPKWVVPWIIMVLGSILYPLIMSRKDDAVFNVENPVVAKYIIGFIVGFAAIGSHRLFEQTMWRFGYDRNGNGNTDNFEESKTSDLKTRRSRRHDDPPDVGL